ncbi:hypothetical protein B484DRAFT_409656, partial [Ochromonadaceae sp. CCMP2298]
MRAIFYPALLALLFACVEAATVNLGTAENYAILAGSSVIISGGAVSGGTVGVSPGTAITHGGTVIIKDSANAAAAQTDTKAAYDEAEGLSGAIDLTGIDLGGLTLTQGVYKFSSSASGNGVLTLNAGGNADAVWVFQIASTLVFASGSSVVMSGGGNPHRVYWQVGSSATITGATVVGNFMAYASITMSGSTVEGRVLARAL